MNRIRVLIVAYYVPPAAGGGVQRVLKFAKYLPDFGVDVDILAPRDPRWVDSDEQLTIPETTTVHRTRTFGPPPGKPADILAGRRGVSRMWMRLRLQPRRFLIPDMYVGWMVPATRAGRRIVRDRGIDVVLSTSPPETDHLIGRRITRATGIPWIVDMRDSWLDEPGLRLDRRSVRIKRWINTKISARTVGRADRVLTVSQPISEEIRQRYPHLAREGRVMTLMNGVDLADTPRESASDAPDRFTITYTGNFFGRRTPRPFLEGLKTFLQERPECIDDIRVLCAGSLKVEDSRLVAADSLLSRVVVERGFVGYDASLKLQRAADLLLLAIGDGPRHQGEVTGKLFEYLAARRPLLAVIPPSGAAANFVRDVRGVTIAAPEDVTGIAQAIGVSYERWIAAGRITTDLPTDEDLAQRISRRERARDLAHIITELTAVSTHTNRG